MEEFELTLEEEKKADEIMVVVENGSICKASLDYLRKSLAHLEYCTHMYLNYEIDDVISVLRERLWKKEKQLFLLRKR